MKEPFKMDENCYHDKAEYIRLHDELLKRMEWLFSHGYTLVSMVAVFWSITLSVLGTFLTSRISTHSPFSFFIPLFVVFLVGLPAILVFPFSVKYQDSLRTVVSLGAYLRVFYELPSMLRKNPYAKGRKGEEQHAIFAWETLHCDTHYERTRGFGIEYTIIAISALVLSMATGIGFLILYDKYRILLAIVFCVYWIAICAVAGRVYKNSCTKDTLERFSNVYLNCYLDSAVASHAITLEEKKQYLAYINEYDKAEKKAFLSMDKKVLFEKYKREQREKHEARMGKVGRAIYRFFYTCADIFMRCFSVGPNVHHIEKMYKGESFCHWNLVYRKLLKISKEYCDEYSTLCSIPEKDLTQKEKERKEELLDILFPNHGTLYGVGAGIEVVIGMVELGENCYINANVKFGRDVKVKTGDYFICAPNVTFGSDKPFEKVGQIELGDDVWVCADVTISKGARIGSHSVIGLGSVVETESVLDGDSIYSGAPAAVASVIENRGVATCKSECAEPSDDYEKAFVAHLRSLDFEGDFSQLLYLLRGEKYNAQDPIAAAVTDYTHALCAEYTHADGKRKAELKDILFPFKGENCVMGENVFIECIGSVRMGNDVTVGNCVTLMGSIVLGDRCTIEEKASLVGIGHEVYHENRHVRDGCMINTSRVIRVDSDVHIGKGKKLAPKTPIEKDQI